MKDILEFGRFVGRIVEAHNQGDTQRERQLANDAELHFDLYGIPDYDSETGRAVEETPFKTKVVAVCSAGSKEYQQQTTRQ